MIKHRQDITGESACSIANEARNEEKEAEIGLRIEVALHGLAIMVKNLTIDFHYEE